MRCIDSPVWRVLGTGFRLLYGCGQRLENTLKERPVLDNEPPSNKGGWDEKNRTILICGMLVLTLVALILYAITRDNALLLDSGIMGTGGIVAVLRYYFGKE